MNSQYGSSIGELNTINTSSNNPYDLSFEEVHIHDIFKYCIRKLIFHQKNRKIIESNKFLPFGEQIKPYSDIQEPHKFAGYLRDSESNIDYLGLRYYNNSIFRFLTTDIIKNSSNNPQTWNPYLYVRNNPLNFIDLFGLTETASQCKFYEDAWHCTETVEVGEDAKKNKKEKDLTTLQQFFWLWYLSIGENLSQESLIDIQSQLESTMNAFSKIKSGYYLGTSLGEYALNYYSSIYSSPEPDLFLKIAAVPGLFYSALWTPETYKETMLTLLSAALNAIEAKNIYGVLEVIPRKSLGKDLASSYILKIGSKLSGEKTKIIHIVIKNGKVIHYDIKWRKFFILY